MPSETVYLAIATLLVGYFTYKWIVYPLYLSPMCKIPGPPPDHFLLGNFLRITGPEAGSDQADFVEKYGNVYKYYGLLNEPILSVLDGKVLQQVLVSDVYTKFSKRKLKMFTKIFGNGILSVEGETHKKQRKLMNPTFGHNSVKDMVPALAKLCNNMKDMWKNEIKKVQNDGKSAKLDMCTYFSKLTLDSIGLVGFDYEFNNLTSGSKLGDSFESLFGSSNKYAVLYRLLIYNFPILEILPLNHKKILDNTSTEIEITTRELVQDKFDKFQKGELKSSDLVSALIKANYGEEINQDERMSLEEIRNQIMTFLIAGHETTSVSMSWTLYYLAKNQKVQDKLREEIVKEFPDKNFVPTFEQVNSLEYLNAVCKETLRIIPPAPMISRETKQDVTINGYFVPKDTLISIPIYTIHHLASIWGEDVEEYNPSRWFTEKVKNLSNYNYLPFITGPRSCIGSKLALTEMKVFLSILIRNFQFNEVEGFKVSRKVNLSYRPDPTVMLWVNEIDG